MTRALRVAAVCLSLSLGVWIMLESQIMDAGAVAANEGTQEAGPRISITSERTDRTGVMEPGDTSVECVTVVREGSPGPAEVGVYLASDGLIGDGLDRYLDLSLEIGSSPEGGCFGFSGEVAFSGSLELFAATHSDMASAVGVWSSRSLGDRATYRITTTLVDDNRAQGLSASATFTWGIQGSATGDAASG